MKYTCSIETVQQNGRFTLFSSKFPSNIYFILYVKFPSSHIKILKKELTISFNTIITYISYSLIFDSIKLLPGRMLLINTKFSMKHLSSHLYLHNIKNVCGFLRGFCKQVLLALHPLFLHPLFLHLKKYFNLYEAPPFIRILGLARVFK